MLHFNKYHIIGTTLSLNNYKKFRPDLKHFVPKRDKNKVKSAYEPGDYDYKAKLYEKQKLRKLYGQLAERQVKRWYKKELKKSNYYNHYNFLIQLELRLDSLVYRLHFTNSIFAARQFILHNKVLVNKKLTNIPSLRLKVQDHISLKSKLKVSFLNRLKKLFILKQVKSNNFLPYIELNYQTVTAILIDKPKITEIFYSFLLKSQRTKFFYSL